MRARQYIRKLLQKLGYDICRFTPPVIWRRRLLAEFRIDTVLDVGANAGQFAKQLMHDIGYEHRIISFEPLTSAFAALTEHAKDTPRWTVCNVALGDVDGTCEMHVAGNSYSSSLLDMLPSLLHSAPEAEYVNTEAVTIRTLDSVFDDYCDATNEIYLKIDTQGYEMNVLRGAANSLRHIDTVQMEMSLTPLYDGEMLFVELYQYMTSMDYALVGIEPAFIDKDTGRLLQVDGVFHRF